MKHLLFAMFAMLVAAIVVGCGGSSSSPAVRTASPRIAIRWPDQGRDIGAPSSAFSVRVTIRRQVNGALESVYEEVLNRASNPAEHTANHTLGADLPLDSYVFDLSFYSEGDANGSVVGQASTSSQLGAAGEVVIDLTVPSRVASVSVLPGQVVQVGASQTLSVEVKGPSGDVLAIKPSVIQWSSASPEHLTFTDGLAHGVSATPSVGVSASVDGVTSSAQGVEVQSEVRATFFPAPKGFVGTSISADGRFVGGYLFVEGIGRVLARWTVGESSVLEVRPLAANAGVTEVSSEGSFAVGGIPTSAWLMPGGIEFEIGFPGSTRVLAQDISSDGRTVVGAFTSDANERAFKWSNAQGSLRVLQGAAAELNFGQVRISRDGTTIVGLTSVGQDRLAVEHDGIVTVHETGPLLPALAVSDGVNPTVVCTRADDTTAITVTSAGVTTLARPEGHTQSVAWDISADGSLVVGETYPSSGAAVPTFWVNGVPHSQREYLQTSYGFALGETSVFRSISGSGRELYGFHNNQDGVLRLMPR